MLEANEFSALVRFAQDKAAEFDLPREQRPSLSQMAAALVPSYPFPMNVRRLPSKDESTELDEFAESDSDPGPAVAYRVAGDLHARSAELEQELGQLKDRLRAMERDAGRELTTLKVDGGASANDLLMQFQSDVLGVQISRPDVVETTALGALFLAGLGTGVWKDQDEVRKTWREQKRFIPTSDRARITEHLARWDAAVAKA